MNYQKKIISISLHVVVMENQLIYYPPQYVFVLNRGKYREGDVFIVFTGTTYYTSLGLQICLEVPLLVDISETMLPTNMLYV